MKNPIKTTVTGILFQSQRAHAGVVLHEVPMALTLVKADPFAAKIAGLTDKRDAHERAKLVLVDKRVVLRGTVKGGQTFLRTAREVINVYAGTVHSPTHVLAGFVDGMKIATKLPEVLRALQGVKTYFTDNEAHQNQPLNVTAARAATLITDITNALAAYDQQNTKVRDLMIARDLSMAALADDLQSLMAELRLKLDPLATKWADFGFNRPGAEQIPVVPAGVIAVVVGPNAIAVKWDASARAGHYRVWKKVVGVDEDFIAVGSPNDLDFALEGLPSGATIEIAVSAVNTGGESAKSGLVRVMTPA